MTQPLRHPESPPRKPQRLLILMPTWLGDIVMATPTIRAIRLLYTEAHVAGLVRDNIAPILDASPDLDELIAYTKGKGGGSFGLARRLAKQRFDTAVLLPNSFRAAALAAMSGIHRRIGYERDGRGMLLTDRLIPLKDKGKFLPVPTLDYYLGIAKYLGVTDADPSMVLFTRPEHEAKAEQLLRDAGHAPALGRSGKPLVLLNPGAQKATKRWAPERFAAVADRLAAEFSANIAVTGSPSERPILDEVIRAAKTPILDLPRQGMDLHMLKAVVKRSALMITNDTGPRHIAAAFGTPVVTLFGPTGPEWTEIHFAKERRVIAPGELDPSGESDRRRPARHMGLITVDAVHAAAADLLSSADLPQSTEGTEVTR